MKRIALFVLCCVVAAGTTDGAIITITFDEPLNPSATPFNVPLGPLGYSSQGYKIVPADANSTIFGFPANTMSGGNNTNFLATITSFTISRATVFNLDKLLLGTFTGSSSATYSINGSAPILAPNVDVFPGLTNLFSVTITSVGGNGLAIDNIQLSDVSVSAVPEPGSIAILGFGAIGMFVRNRRRNRAALIA
jgi:hypothetical protein